MSWKGMLFGTSSALMLAAGATGAWAQEADDEAPRDTIVVTGVRASISQSLDVKRQNTQVVDAIVAEDIGKLPDNNVVEALQRVTGVQITDRGSGEASAIFIRGLPDVLTTWNGRNVFTASGRALALQDIPSNLVRQVEVYKTRAAEQIETGIAGQINVISRRPLDFDENEFAVSARGIYQEQADRIDPNISGLASGRWTSDIGDFGALVNVSFAETNFRNQSITAGAMVPFATAVDPVPGFTPLERIFNSDGRVAEDPIWQPGLDRGLSDAPGSTLTINGVEEEYLLARDALFAVDGRGQRKRPAVTAALQFAPNDRSTYTFEVFYQGYREQLFNNLHFTFADWWGSLGDDPASTFTLYPDTNIIKTRTVGFPFGFQSGDITDQSTDSFVYALNGEWAIGDRLNVAADLSYQTSEFESQFIAVRTIRVPESITVDFNADDGLPSWEFNDNAEMLDPNSWTVAELFENAARNEGDAVTFAVDADYDLDPSGSGIFKSVSAGFRYDSRGASEANPGPVPVPFLGVPMTDLPAEFLWSNSDFFDGRANVPTSWLVPNGYYVFDNQDEIRDLYGVTAPVMQDAFEIDEKTTAAYVQVDAEPMVAGRPLAIQAGLRYVNVETDMVFSDLNASPQVTTNAGASVDDVLPAVTLRYDVTDDVIVRFNYGETLRRPNFVDLNPNFALTGDLTMVGRGSGTGGNPDLAPTEAQNIDVTAEWYFAPDSALYGTLFRRKIDGLVVPLTRRQVIAGTGLNTDVFVVTQPVNASDGVLKGLEAGFVYFPDNLPGVLDGLGALGSLTVLDSSQNIPLTNSEGEIIGEENTEFFGVSDMSFNITGAYERGPIGARLSYVWRDDFLNNNEARLFANPIGVWRRAEQSLDLQLNYDVGDNASFSFDVVNLTDELEQSYYAFAEAGGPDTHNFGNVIVGRTFAFGLRYSF